MPVGVIKWISPGDFPMSVTTPTTAEELLKLPSGEHRYELIAGELFVMSPGNWRHGALAGEMHGLLWSYVKAKSLGVVFAAETGYLLQRDPDTVRAPDVSFIHRDNFPADNPKDAYWPGAPDLAVEVLSPDDRKTKVAEKTQAWLDAGAKLVWNIDPQAQRVTVHRADGSTETLTLDDQLTGDDIVPGFSCRVGDIFGV
jgi:Uma2 family endonuclease